MPIVGGGAPFNGGTVTNDLRVDGSVTGAELSVSTTSHPSFDVQCLNPAGDFVDALIVRNSTDVVLEVDTGGEVGISSRDASAVPLYVNDHTGARVLSVSDAGVLAVPQIPAADPHIVGALYTVAGTVHVSAG